MSVNKYYQIVLLAALLAFSVPVVPAAAAQVDDLVAQALSANPEIKASQARWESFVNRARQAGTFEDPMIMLKAQNLLIRDPLNFSRENMTSKVFGISQMLPYFGKRALKREIADHQAESSRWAVEERKLELQRMVKETWYQIYFVDRSMDTVERSIASLDDINRFAETMYGVGQGLQQDVLKAQLQRSRMEDMRIVLEQKRRSLVAQLNALLYRPVDTPVERPGDMEITPLIMNAGELEQLAEEKRPQLKSLAEQIEKAKAAQRLAEREFFPDFTVSLEYMQREPAMGGEGYDMYSAGISFNLPVQRERRHAMVAEAQSETHMAQDELNMLRNQIRSQIGDTLARLERGRKLADLYRNGILPQSSHALEASMAAYRVGKAEFMNVLDSQMAQFNYEREYYDAVADYQMQLAVLEGVVGVSLPPALNTAALSGRTGERGDQ